MPLHDYKCIGCGKLYEDVWHKINEDPSCESCGGELEKLVSKNTTFKLEGDGWYKDGYQKPKDTPPSKSSDE